MPRVEGKLSKIEDVEFGVRYEGDQGPGGTYA